MDQVQKNTPLKLNYDKAFKSLQPDEMTEALNHEVGVTIVNGKANASGGKGTPLPANYVLVDMDKPLGETYSIGTFYSELTNEEYSWQKNSNGVDYISRINGNSPEDKRYQVVYQGCLDLSADPKHSIEQFRAHMRIEKVCPNRAGKYLMWTDGTDFGIGYLDVEASIETNFFSTDFFKICSPNPCDFVKLCVPNIRGCIHAEFVPLDQSQVGLNNNLLNKGFMFMVQHVYYDGRESIWSDRSTLMYQQANACFSTGSGLSRCLKLRVPVGNAMVDKIRIAFSDNGGLTWFITETVDKYKKYNSLQQKWYQRQLSELLNFSENDCSFDYIFCNDKDRIQVSTEEVTRLRNPLPRNAQSFIEIGNALGVVNYIDGICPIDKVEVEKVSIDIDCPTDVPECASEFATVTVRAVIQAYPSGVNRYIYRFGGSQFDSADDASDTAYYGGTDTVILPGGPPITFGQNFSRKTRGHIVYIEGTDYWGEMKQWQADKGFKNKKEIGVIASMANTSTQQKALDFINGGGFYYQEYKIKVLKGTRGFLRIASQSETQGTGSSQNTSTSVMGIINDIANVSGKLILNANMDFLRKEIYFDTCNGDVDLKETFRINDIARPSSISSTLAAYSGYIKDKNGIPLEGLGFNELSSYTDHNGFYFFHIADANPTISIKGETSCSAFGEIQSMVLIGTIGAITLHNEEITNDTFINNFYLQVEQKVVDCDGNPIPGIRVAIGGAKSRITDSSGIAHLRTRNYSNRQRLLHTVVMNNNGCFTIDCNKKCNPCMPSTISNGVSCYFGSPYFSMANAVVNIADVLAVRNGLKAGGRYPFAVVAEGDCGKLSAAYLVSYIDIPRTQEKNKLGFCNFKIKLGTQSSPGDPFTNIPTFPSWVTNLKVVRGANQNPFELQWIVDKIEFVGDGKIKLTIQSLNDYNQKYFFQSNTIYQWTKGDRIEFIRNGDGKIISNVPNGVLNYLTISPFHDTLISGLTSADANYFNQLIIEDDNRLGNITKGAIIELQRPKSNSSETIYHEICVSIPVENGVPLINESTFSTFDTYIVGRTSGNFLGFFESKYPSDFWGKTTDGVGLDDGGKAHVENKYETEKRYGRNISLNSPGVFNRFGDTIKTFGAPEHGDITAMHITDGQVILAIGEHDSFLAQSADNLARVNRDGTITALGADAVIGDAQPKLSGKFGCQYDSIGSVYFGDGYASWIDKNKGAHAVHNYSECVDAGIGRTQSFWKKKCQEISSHNLGETDTLNMMRFVTGMDMLTGDVNITMKSLRMSAINNNEDKYALKNVTIAYNPAADIYKRRASYTPERYGNVTFYDESGCSFTSYFNGIPYIHPLISSRFNEFYGVACDWMLGVVLNQFDDKDKTPLAFEVQSVKKWFVKKVTTENPNFISEIPPIRVKREKDKWNGAFLKNIASNGGLFEGDVMRSFYANVLFIRDNSIGEGEYNTIDNSKRVEYSELGAIFFKFEINEQTGFTENL